MRVVYVLCLVVAIGGQICNPKAHRDKKETTFKTESGSCFADNQLPTALSDLASGDPSRVDRAKSELLHKSKVSTACREEVVRALMKAMDNPDVDVNRDTSNFYLWLYGAEILGDLEAVEALDLLISHLNLHHPVFGGPSLSKHPAKLGVITMGPIAIPKLSEALKSQSDPKIRYAAIYCIANIGGKSAITALREALESESDECAKRLIKVSLDSFDEKGTIKNQAEWGGRFNCNKVADSKPERSARGYRGYRVAPLELSNAISIAVKTSEIRRSRVVTRRPLVLVSLVSISASGFHLSRQQRL